MKNKISKLLKIALTSVIVLVPANYNYYLESQKWTDNKIYQPSAPEIQEWNSNRYQLCENENTERDLGQYSSRVA